MNIESLLREREQFESFSILIYSQHNVKHFILSTHNRRTTQAIGKILKKLEENGSVTDIIRQELGFFTIHTVDTTSKASWPFTTPFIHQQWTGIFRTWFSERPKKNLVSGANFGSENDNGQAVTVNLKHYGLRQYVFSMKCHMPHKTSQLRLYCLPWRCQ